jgi:DNA helicase-2/ATP-dependent DNA helicase PcrA
MQNDILDGLTPQQLEAVQLRSGVIVAGAGAGKTKTLVSRITHDQRERGIDPAEQVVVTFTNAAAREIRERLERAGAKTPAHLGTLHSLAFRFVREAWGTVSVLSDAQFDAIIKAEMKRTRVPATLTAARDAIMNGDARGNLALLAKAIIGRLRGDRAIHPDVMLRVMLDTLRATPRQFLVYVDEAQDSASVDFSIYSNLARKEGTLLIGDPRQSIYGFRGARPDLFLDALRAYGDGVVELPHNFRSEPEIVANANRIAALMNLPVIEGVMIATKPQGLGFVRFEGEFATSEAEAVAAAEWAESREFVGTHAILCRYNATVEVVAAALRGRGVPVIVAGEPEETDPAVEALAKLDRIPASWESAMMALGVSFADQERLLPALAAVLDPADIADAIREAFSLPTAASNAAVVVSTVHGAKGLEWDHVRLVGADAAAFDPTDAENVRLAYVAATRPRCSFSWSSARDRAGRVRVRDLSASTIFSP